MLHEIVRQTPFNRTHDYLSLYKKTPVAIWALENALTTLQRVQHQLGLTHLARWSRSQCRLRRIARQYRSARFHTVFAKHLRARRSKSDLATRTTGARCPRTGTLLVEEDAQEWRDQVTEMIARGVHRRMLQAIQNKAVLFLFEFTSPRTYDPGFRFFVKQMFKTGGKKRFLQKWA